jgi:hypothetical protein
LLEYCGGVASGLYRISGGICFAPGQYKLDPQSIAVTTYQLGDKHSQWSSFTEDSLWLDGINRAVDLNTAGVNR